MALIKGFKATNIFHAFILNSIAVALATVIGIETKKYTERKNFIAHEWERVLITFIATFGSCILTYTLLHIIFGYGGGMLTSP